MEVRNMALDERMIKAALNVPTLKHIEDACRDLNPTLQREAFNPMESIVHISGGLNIGYHMVNGHYRVEIACTGDGKPDFFDFVMRLNSYERREALEESSNGYEII